MKKGRFFKMQKSIKILGFSLFFGFPPYISKTMSKRKKGSFLYALKPYYYRKISFFNNRASKAESDTFQHSLKTGILFSVTVVHPELLEIQIAKDSRGANSEFSLQRYR